MWEADSVVSLCCTLLVEGGCVCGTEASYRMNLLFRKNLAEGGGGGVGGVIGGKRSGGGGVLKGGAGGGGVGGGRGLKGKAAVKGPRAASSGFEEHYGLRTHIYFSPPALEAGAGGGGGRLSGGWGGGLGDGISTGLAEDPASRLQQFKVSFKETNGYSNNRTRKPISLLPVPKAELSQLRSLDKDCFIIPVASLDRFLPAGVPMPLLESEEQKNNVSVLEVEDPKICLLIHLMTQMEPIEPILESPLALPHLQQKKAASDLLSEVTGSKSAAQGILLANIEKNAEFPFIAYYVINKTTTDPTEFFHNCRAASLRKFDPRHLRYTAAHTFDLFNEVATIARPPLDPTSKRPLTTSTGYIVTLYKVFEGDDGEKFEKNWLYWTGARMIYRALPKSVGLRRITLHKSVSSGDKLYFLMVECSNLLGELGAAAQLIPALRARLCGYTGLYTAAAGVF